jgi:hypothetical protein
MYSVKTIKEELQSTLHKYLEADYHIWDESLIVARKALLNSKNITSSDPRLEASPTYKSGVTFSKMAIPKVASNFLTSLSKIENSGVYAEPRAHQRIALEKFLGAEREIIVATGTGSGKTESFLYPILGGFAIEGERSKINVNMHGCRVLLLYPMNALVNDQLTRLRKMFGNEDVANFIEQQRGRRATFGIYTSKTDYAGTRDKKKDNRLQIKIKELYSGDALKRKADLSAEGLWPAKNMQSFIDSSFTTSKLDVELYTRQEIQASPPDILVTNYSMLEYMLARPIERDIFDKTSSWLNADPANYLTIVLDEAHMYRGSAGAEVALLLRRLQSRLQVDRSKIKFILTSASLGSDENDKANVISFAKDLTGKRDFTPDFELITSIIEEKSNEATPNAIQINALMNFNMLKMNSVIDSLETAVEEVNLLFGNLGIGGFANYPTDISTFKNEIYKKLEIFPPAALLANKLTNKPTSYESLVSELFGDKENFNALEALVSLCTFAQLTETQQVFLPIRLHLMYRGIPGLYACINSNCPEKHEPNKPSLLGRLYTYPALNCGCGGRVFEILTHRDCGAAYIRGFISESSQDFLLHQQAIKSSSEKLIETHFLVEPLRNRSTTSLYIYIHIFSGLILRSNPDSDAFIQVCVSNDMNVSIDGKQLWTFPKKCPVCSRGWKIGTTKIQDLATKGEAPFSYLVRSQVINQPATKKLNRQSPLGGRKTLVFSDGRQKAARLARDIPRNVEKDIFRSCIVLAIRYLEEHYRLPSLKRDLIYLAFLFVISEKNILLFDGNDREILLSDLRRLDGYLVDDEVFEDIFIADSWTPTAQFSQMLLINIMSPYYSLSALTIGAIYPEKKALKAFTKKILGYGLAEQDGIEISLNWLTYMIEEKKGFDKEIPLGVRQSAVAGYNPGESEVGIALGNYKKFFSKNLYFVDNSHLISLEESLLSIFCENINDKYFVNPSKVMIRLKLDETWYICSSCTKLSIELIREKCPHCGNDILEHHDPDDSKYLKARKGFYRDPVIKALKKDSFIYNLCVEEHTAQLSYRDQESPVSTNESYERRFKDILIEDKETPVDILSCTTTMEVGVDIGSLIAVSMRNVPPARQNYQQRAGRAGRRGSAVSTVLTFAQTGSHDSHFFENPDEIISGNPPPPEIDINNAKIIKRHVVAAIIQSYFHRLKLDNTTKNNDLLSVLGLTKSFYGDEGDFTFSSLREWLSSEFESSGVKAEISAWIPSEVVITIDEIKDHLLRSLISGEPIDLDNSSSYEEKFLNFLFTLDLLPSYAFPRLVCAFTIEKMKSKYDITTVECPQQNLSTALTEYAPGRLVVVNKKTYKVGTIAARSPHSEENRAAALFNKKRQYLQCPNCLFTEIFDENSLNRITCTHCGEKGVEVLDVIQPEVTYPSGRKEINEYSDEDIYTSATSAQLPFMGDSLQQNWRVYKRSAKITSEVNQLLVAINKGDESLSEESGFWVCSSCGQATAEKDKPGTPHERDYFVMGHSENSKCHGTIERVNIGYSFYSDVFILRLPLDFPMVQESQCIEKEGLVTAARTLAEAILQKASVELEIDPSEMNCGIRFLKIEGVNFLDIFIYDTASGGAGYAHMTGQHFNFIFSEVVKLLKKSECCETSCYRCLNHYGNRWHHTLMDKKYGLMLWNKINDDHLPDLYTSSGQLHLAASLHKLMELEGWSITLDGETNLLLEKQGRRIKFVIYPVILDQSYVKTLIEKIDVYISDYEVQKSLPSVYNKLLSI